MDAQRFDSLARALAGRLSRRNALRHAGAAASASLLAAGGVRAAPARAMAQAANGDPLYTMVRRYTLDGSTGAVRQALQRGYVDDACRAPGFVAYYAVEDEDGDFVTVAVFRTRQDFENFTNAEASWIAQNLANLLPAPDEAISGVTHVYAADPEVVRNTCPAGPAPTVFPAPTSPSAPTSAPAPTNTPPPTAGPPSPTPTPPPPCKDQGCVCATGTQRPCRAGLVCCPTTDIAGGPGVCQTEEVCYPHQCGNLGDACEATCNWGDACPACCSNYCNSTGQCDNAPPGCTGKGCACITGAQSTCDAGLICCGTSSAPGGPGSCQTEADCNPSCTSQGCDCNGGVQGNCGPGLVCCQEEQSIPGGAGTCQPEAQCAPPPCTGQGCDCNGGVQGACDDGLVCCQGGQPIPGGAGTCQPDSQCQPPPCTGEGCACNGGVEGACDDGLVCCQGGQPIPGGAGTCTAAANCSPPPCTGQGCACNGGVQGACDDGLVCCQEGGSVPGGPGACQPADACGPPPCTDNGAGCDATCNWGDECAGCCSGYCNSTGQCNAPPPATCTAAGCACDTGTESPCDDGLTCCQSTDTLGGPGVCQASC